MKKRILMLTAAFVVLAGTLAGFSAFEAHVVNVSATIENALSVSPESIKFGTVFPQEYIEKNMRVALSNSFVDEERVDDVEYFIRQKPMPREEAYDGEGQNDFASRREAAHWCWSNQVGMTDDQGNEITELSEDYYDNCYYNLCPYLSKHSEDENDDDLNAFHNPVNNDVNGYLAKSDNDTEDNWIIDLAVPCFDGSCAQDWESFVTGINSEATPSEWTLDPSLEHEQFGCDLWVEVSGISRSNSIGIYEETGDGSGELGQRLGTMNYSYATSTNMLEGTIALNEYGNSVLASGDYALVLNGPRSGSVQSGSTNDLLASQACLNGDLDDGWWMRYTDNTGETVCNLPEPLPADYAGAEGYYNFDTGVSSVDGYSFSVSLPDGNYNEVQFLIKDMSEDWETVGEYPGVGEINGLTSFFDFNL